jgi:uncharacterized membrane protein YhaH (DUF805 family)
MEEIKKLFSFDKKVKRTEFILVWLFAVIITGLVMIPIQEIVAEQLHGVTALIAIGAFIWVMAANYVGRTKDTGINPHFAWLAFVPLVNLIFLLYLIFTPSK